MIVLLGVRGRIKMFYQIFLGRSYIPANIGDGHVGKVDVNL